MAAGTIRFGSWGARAAAGAGSTTANTILRIVHVRIGHCVAAIPVAVFRNHSKWISATASDLKQWWKLAHTDTWRNLCYWLDLMRRIVVFGKFILSGIVRFVGICFRSTIIFSLSITNRWHFHSVHWATLKEIWVCLVYHIFWFPSRIKMQNFTSSLLGWDGCMWCLMATVVSSCRLSAVSLEISCKRFGHNKCNSLLQNQQHGWFCTIFRKELKR